MRRFGIRIPGSAFGRLGSGGLQGPRPGGRNRGAPPQPEFTPVTYFELLGPGKDDRRRIEVAAETGIEVAGSLREGVLSFEIKVPLAAGQSYLNSLSASAGQTLGLGLESPELERPEGGPRGGRPGGIGGGRPGGMGGGRGRGPGGMGGPARTVGPGRLQIKQLDRWTTLALAHDAQ
jgi:hypothetical protein